MRGDRLRRKGKRTELELVAALRPFFPNARRNLDQWREQDGRDVLGTPGMAPAKRKP